MKKLLIVFLSLFLYANNIYDAYFKKIGNYYNIDYRILKTIAVIESGLNSNCININIKNKNQYKRAVFFLRKEKIKFKQYRGQMISFKVNKQNYLDVLRFLDKYKYSFDIGIMQINNLHAKTFFMQELLLTNPFYNIYIGGKILRECFDKSKDAYQTISCYNSGSIYKIRKNYLKKFFDTYKFYVFK